MADSEVRQKFEAWGRSEGYVKEYLNMADCGLWAAWQTAFEAGMRAGEIAMKEKAATRATEFYLAKGDALDIARAIRELPAAPEEKKQALSGAEESKK